MEANVQQQRRVSVYRLVVVVACGILFLIVALGYISRAAMDVYVYANANVRSETWVAPYVDIAQKPGIFFEGYENPSLNQVVVGSILANPSETCSPAWGSHYDLSAAARALDLDRRLVRFRERGGVPIVSLGGDKTQELASVCPSVEALTAAYQSVFDRYRTILDFVIDESVISDRQINSRRAEALARLQKQNEHLKIWVSVPATPSGLSEDVRHVLRGLLAQGIEPAGINLMAMNFGDAKADSQSMLDAVLQSVTNSQRMLVDVYNSKGLRKSDDDLWRLMGITPMIGQNEFSNERFSLEDASDLLAFLSDKNIGRISFWTINRDVSCGVNSRTVRASKTCSGVDQRTLEFARVFVANFPKSVIDTGWANAAHVKTRQAYATQELSVDSDPDLNPYPLWRQQKTYQKGDKIVWQGRVYQSKWWSEAHQPDAPAEKPWDSPWRLLGPVLSSDQVEISREASKNEGRITWTTERVFQDRDEVLHKDMVFRARWWTQGSEPELQPDSNYDHPWIFVGNINCTGDSCVESGMGTNLIIDFNGLSNVDVEIREDDGIEGTVGDLVHSYSKQSGQKTYREMRGAYDLVFSLASSDLVVDSLDCWDGDCSPGPIAATLAVDYAALHDIRLEIRTSDGVKEMAGDLIEARPQQSGQKTYKVLRNQYDLIFKKASFSYVVDAVDCRESNCEAGNIAASLSVDYERLTNVDLEIRGDDGFPSSAGALVERHAHQNGFKTYNVLLGQYDLILKKGAGQLILDDINCQQERCGVPAITAELRVNLGQVPTSLEIRVDDGQIDSTGGLIESHDDQFGVRRYALLRGHYDVALQDDNWLTIEDSVDCSGPHCEIGLSTGNGEWINPEIAKLELELAQLKARFTDNYPDVIALRRRLQDVRGTN